MKRTSVVNQIKLQSVSTASQFMVGDSAAINAHTQALAVQRQVAVFFKNEADFAHYPLFTKSIPKPIVDEQIQMIVDQQSPYIKVNSIHVIGVAQASAMQIGSTQHINLESRIKHFRQFVKPNDGIVQD